MVLTIVYQLSTISTCVKFVSGALEAVLQRQFLTDLQQLFPLFQEYNNELQSTENLLAKLYHYNLSDFHVSVDGGSK